VEIAAMIHKLKLVENSQKQLIFKHDKIEVVVNHSVTAAIQSYRQYDKKSVESGGLFLGFRTFNSIHITGFTTPFPKDIATRKSFTLKDPLHQEIIDSQWNLSNGLINFVGDWHTHPEPIPSPSFWDRRYWKRLTQPKLPMIYGIQGLDVFNLYLSIQKFK